MRSNFQTRALATGITAGLCGCFAAVDVDRFHYESVALETPDSSAASMAGAYTNLKFTLMGMTPHVSQMFEYRIVDNSTNFIQSRGIVNPLGSPEAVSGPDAAIGPNAVLNVAGAIPPKLNGTYHLDFYADVNHSGGYDGLGMVSLNDHAWRIDPLEDYPPGTVTPIDGTTQVTFTHNTFFTDIDTYPSGTPNKSKDTGLAATVSVTNAGPLQNDLIQVRIVSTDANRAVGMYRIPKMTQATFAMQVPGCIEVGNDYNVYVYVDANGNGAYDDPSKSAGDLGWKLSATGDASGLNVSVDLQMTAGAKVDVGAP
jgi:hypothetical protein